MKITPKKEAPRKRGATVKNMKLKSAVISLSLLICCFLAVTLAACVPPTGSETVGATDTTVDTTTAAATTAETTAATTEATTSATTTAATTKATTSATTTAKATTTTTKVTTTKATTTTKARTTLKTIVVTTKAKTTVPPSSVSLDAKTAELFVGQSMRLTATAYGASVSEWFSSNAAVADVSDGTVTALSAGNATIFVKLTSGKMASCKVTVVAVSDDSPRIFTATASELGMLPVDLDVVGDNVTVTILDDYQGIRIFSAKPGSATVSARDDFGNVVTVSVKVNDSLEITEASFTKLSKPNTLNAVLDCGAIPNDSIRDTNQIQSAIDRLAQSGGGTVYVPRGFYDISLLLMKENVTLELAGRVADATVGYTDEIKARVDGGEFAVFRTAGGDMFRNLVAGSHGATGIDNFHIRGGVFDMQGKSRCILFVCADNASMTNCIIKDCLNDHAIQVTGSTNITIQNVMFAGYRTGTNLTTGEEVQIEAGCNGATGGDIAVFGDAEYYYSRNVLIDNCYFGPSDEYGSQTIAIGHHGHRDHSDADGLTISNCVFVDNSIYSIKTISYSNVRIIDNTFISNGDNRVTTSGLNTYNTESFIYVILGNSDIKGKPTSSSSTAYLAKAYSAQGTQNMEISGNSFTLGGDTVSRRIIVASGNNYTMGAQTVSSMLRYIKYGTPAVYYTGYVPVQNVIYNLVITDNDIDIKCTSAGSTFKDAFLKFTRVVGLTVRGNDITCGTSFTSSASSIDGVRINGMYTSSCIVGTEMYTRTIKMSAFSDSSIGVMLTMANGGTVKHTSSGSQNLILKSDGNGEILLTYSDSGSVTVTPVAKEGYRFVGWTKGGAAYNPTGDTLVSSSTTLTAVFAK